MFNRTDDRGRRAQEQARREAKRQREELEGQQKLERQRQQAFLTTARQAHDRSDFLARLRTEEAHYANTVILLGYGGFFALWATASGKLAAPWYGVLGLLAGVSLLCFVGFELVKTFSVARAINAATARGKDGHRLYTEGTAVDFIQAKYDSVNRLWIWFFAPSAVTGLLAGFGLLGFFVWFALSGK